MEVDNLKKMGYFQKWKERLFVEKLVNRKSVGTEYIGDITNLNNIYFILDNIEWDENVFDSLEEIIEWDSAVHGRINNTYDYWRFIEFQDKLINDEKYREKTVKSIRKYRGNNIEGLNYIWHFNEEFLRVDSAMI